MYNRHGLVNFTFCKPPYPLKSVYDLRIYFQSDKTTQFSVETNKEAQQGSVCDH